MLVVPKKYRELLEKGAVGDQKCENKGSYRPQNKRVGG